MATRYSPRIVTDGLVFAIDAASPRCYDGSGSVTDLVAGAEGTRQGNEGFTTHFGGGWDFDGSDDCINFGNLAVANFGTGDFSAEIVFEHDFLSSWRTLMGKGASGASGWGLTTNGTDLLIDIDDGANIHLTVQTIVVGTAYHFIAVWDRSANAIGYVNGEQKSVDSISSYSGSVSTPSKNLALGTYSAGTSWDFNGRIHLARLYNKALTAAEVTQNFRAVKGRFGL